MIFEGGNTYRLFHGLNLYFPDIFTRDPVFPETRRNGILVWMFYIIIQYFYCYLFNKKKIFLVNFFPNLGCAVQPAPYGCPTCPYRGARQTPKNFFFNLFILHNYIIQPDMVQHKSVIYLPLPLHGQIVHLCEEMITLWPKV